MLTTSTMPSAVKRGSSQAKENLYSPVICPSKQSLGTFLSSSKHFNYIRKNSLTKSFNLNLRNFFKQRLQKMTETPLILGPGKSGVISLKCKLGGSHILKEEDILLLKTFMNSMKNCPTKSQIKRTLEGRVMTSGEHLQVLHSIVDGLEKHSRECEELGDKRKSMKSAAALLIKESRKIISRLENEESETEPEREDDEGVSEDDEYDKATQSDIDFIDDSAVDEDETWPATVSNRGRKKTNIQDYDSEEEVEAEGGEVKNKSRVKNVKTRNKRLEEIDEPERGGPSFSKKKGERDEREERGERGERDEERDDEREDGYLSDVDMSDVEKEGGGFIPLAKKKTEDVTGAITARQVLLTGQIRKRYENTLLSSVIGIGPGSMRIETELNEDGTLKKKKGGGYPAANESSWYFYKGSLSESGSSQVPLKSGIRQNDQHHLDTLCTDITVRAFSQGVWAHKGIKKLEERHKAAKKIMSWLQREVAGGVMECLDQIMGEVRQKASHMREEEYETKRKALENFEQLKKKVKK